jgi:broad-specificity NMP kinase
MLIQHLIFLASGGGKSTLRSRLSNRGWACLDADDLYREPSLRRLKDDRKAREAAGDPRAVYDPENEEIGRLIRDFPGRFDLALFHHPGMLRHTSLVCTSALVITWPPSQIVAHLTERGDQRSEADKRLNADQINDLAGKGPEAVQAAMPNVKLCVPPSIVAVDSFAALDDAVASFLLNKATSPLV